MASPTTTTRTMQNYKTSPGTCFQRNLSVYKTYMCLNIYLVKLWMRFNLDLYPVAAVNRIYFLLAALRISCQGFQQL